MIPRTSSPVRPVQCNDDDDFVECIDSRPPVPDGESFFSRLLGFGLHVFQPLLSRGEHFRNEESMGNDSDS